MAVSIRLRRMGRKKKPHYRIVVADTASPRDGRFIEILGYYRPLTAPARLVLNVKRVDYWISNGATPSGTVRSLIAKARSGGDAAVALGELDRETDKAKKAELLAAKRRAEADAAAAAAAATAAAAEVEKAAAEVETEAASEEEAAEEEAAPEPEQEAEAEAEVEVEAESEAEPTPEAKAEQDAAEGEEEASEEK